MILSKNLEKLGKIETDLWLVNNDGSSALQSNQVKHTPQYCINELIIWNLNPLVVSRMQ